jgi:hypothetical protein
MRLPQGDCVAKMNAGILEVIDPSPISTAVGLVALEPNDSRR